MLPSSQPYSASLLSIRHSQSGTEQEIYAEKASIEMLTLFPYRRQKPLPKGEGFEGICIVQAQEE